MNKHDLRRWRPLKRQSRATYSRFYDCGPKSVTAGLGLPRTAMNIYIHISIYTELCYDTDPQAVFPRCLQRNSRIGRRHRRSIHTRAIPGRVSSSRWPLCGHWSTGHWPPAVGWVERWLYPTVRQDAHQSRGCKWSFVWKNYQLACTRSTRYNCTGFEIFIRHEITAKKTNSNSNRTLNKNKECNCNVNTMWNALASFCPFFHVSVTVQKSTQDRSIPAFIPAILLNLSLRHFDSAFCSVILEVF